MKKFIYKFITLSLVSISFIASTQAEQISGPMVNNSVFYSNSILSVTAVTEVFGGSQKITAAIVELSSNVDAAKIKSTNFIVDGRRIIAAKVVATPDIYALPSDGNYVVLTLNPSDESSVIFAPGIDVAAQIVVHQEDALPLANGNMLPTDGKAVINTRVKNLVVDDFQQFRFRDPKTGLTLDYNLYIPKNYSSDKSKYPLVVFMHDAGVTGSDSRRTLKQGLGAVSFASESDQAKHPAFVLAPQFPVAIANDDSQISIYADMVPRLLKQLESKYPVDSNRLYATGQSGGCMTSIALNVTYPNLFAGTLCVAGQWDPKVVSPMAHNNFWAIVSEDDNKAFPGMTAIMESLKQQGQIITRGSWNATAPEAEQDAAVRKLRNAAGDNHLFFTTFTAGSVLTGETETNRGAGHVNTWRYAYAIPALRDWLLEQRKPHE